MVHPEMTVLAAISLNELINCGKMPAIFHREGEIVFSSESDKISSEENIRLYDRYVEKLQKSTFSNRLALSPLLPLRH